MVSGFYYAILACLLWGVAPIIEKVGLRGFHPILAVFIRSIAISIALTFYFLFHRGILEAPQPSFKDILLIVIGGILAGMLGQIFYFKSLKYWEASRAVPIAGSYPLIAFFLSVLLLGEPITLIKFVGAILVVAGIILLRF